MPTVLLRLNVKFCSFASALQLLIISDVFMFLFPFVCLVDEAIMRYSDSIVNTLS